MIPGTQWTGPVRPASQEDTLSFGNAFGSVALTNISPRPICQTELGDRSETDFGNNQGLTFASFPSRIHSKQAGIHTQQRETGLPDNFHPFPLGKACWGGGSTGKCVVLVRDSWGHGPRLRHSHQAASLCLAE